MQPEGRWGREFSADVRSGATRPKSLGGAGGAAACADDEARRMPQASRRENERRRREKLSAACGRRSRSAGSRGSARAPPLVTAKGRPRVFGLLRLTSWCERRVQQFVQNRCASYIDDGRPGQSRVEAREFVGQDVGALGHPVVGDALERIVRDPGLGFAQRRCAPHSGPIDEPSREPRSISGLLDAHTPTAEPSFRVARPDGCADDEIRPTT